MLNGGMRSAGMRAGGEETPAPKPDEKPAPKEGEKSFTNEEVEAIVEKRLSRDRSDSKKQLEEMSAKLQGFSDVEGELKTLREERQKREDEKLSAEERVKAHHTRELKTIADERDTLRSKLDVTSETYKDYRKRVALTSMSAKLDAIAPEQVVMLLKNRVTIVEDGNGSDTLVFKGDDGAEITIDDGVKEFLEKNPHLVKNPGGAGGGTRPPVSKHQGTLTVEKIRMMTPAERKEAQPQIDVYLKTLAGQG